VKLDRRDHIRALFLWIWILHVIKILAIHSGMSAAPVAQGRIEGRTRENGRGEDPDVHTVYGHKPDRFGRGADRERKAPRSGVWYIGP
jgi:hypothetical protein